MLAQGFCDRCIRIDGTKPSKQEGWKCHQGSAAGERVQGSAEERGDNEDDGSHEMRYCVWVAVCGQLTPLP